MRSRIAAVALLLVVLSAHAGGPLPSGAVQLPPESIRWTPGSPAMPPGTQVAVLEGDPKASKWFTIRLKVPAGAVIGPHWHPRDERVTVISGQAAVGFGDTVDAAGVTRFGPGSFYINPANSRHYLLFSEETVLQATGVGPWEIHFVEPPARAP